MNELPRRLRRAAALCVAGLSCIGTGALLHALSTDRVPEHAPTRVVTEPGTEAGCEIHSRRLC